MNTLFISNDEYVLFAAFLEEATGILLGEKKEYLVISRLKGLMIETRINSFAELIEKANNNPKLRETIIDAMTTNETSWYRDEKVFECLEKKIFPELEKTGRNDFHVWSAACSTGQEPYSISMCAQDFLTLRRPNIEVEIVGTDICKKVLDKAIAAYYEELVTSRGLPADKKEKYFSQTGKFWEITEQIKNRVSFRIVNLKRDFTTLGTFDVIFCRNVLIYFSSELKKDVIERLTRQLKPGGYLFLGGSESMPDYTDKFVMHKYESIVYYQLKS